jgi:hypothetical protein
MKDKQQISAVVARLRSFHAAIRHERFEDALLRWIEDPLKPKTDKGSLRINPIVILLTIIALLAGGTFLFFSFIQL